MITTTIAIVVIMEIKLLIEVLLKFMAMQNHTQRNRPFLESIKTSVKSMQNKRRSIDQCFKIIFNSRVFTFKFSSLLLEIK